MKEALITTVNPAKDAQDNLFQDETPEVRMANLDGMAHLVDEDYYMRPLSEEEITERKNALITNSVRLNVLSAEKKAVTAKINGEMTGLSKDNRVLLDEITHEAVEEKGKIYSIITDDKKWVDEYNVDGIWLKRRRISKADLQTHINMRVID